MISKRDTLKNKQVKAAGMMDAAGMGRKILRFGPSIIILQTIINNLKTLAAGKSKEPSIILMLRTLSQFFVGMFFICDHYIWLFKMGLVSSPTVKAKMEYWSFMGFFLDCITNIIKNSILLAN